MNSDNNEFWMVWNPKGLSPTKEHDSQESALKEANRLAAKNPGYKYYVLRAETYSLATVPAPVTKRLLTRNTWVVDTHNGKCICV